MTKRQGTLEILNFKIGYNHDTIFKLPIIKVTLKYEPCSCSTQWLSFIKSSHIRLPASSHGCVSNLKTDEALLHPVRAFCVEPTLVCLYGIEKNQVTQMAAKIRQISPPSTYTSKGLFIVKLP